MRVASVLLSLCTYVGWGVTYLVFTPLCLLVSLLPKKYRYTSRLYFSLTYLWNRFLLFFSFAEIEFTGLENSPNPKDQPAIFVANHLSSLDIPIVEYVLKTYPHIWISKQAYRKIPLFGLLLERMHVLVRRENPRAAARSFARVLHLARENQTHIVIFPEGTRSLDGKLGPFHEGFAALAEKLGRPVIPISIKHAQKVWPKGSLVLDVCRHTIEVRVGPPLPMHEGEDRSVFASRVRDWFHQVR